MMHTYKLCASDLVLQGYQDSVCVSNNWLSMRHSFLLKSVRVALFFSTGFYCFTIRPMIRTDDLHVASSGRSERTMWSKCICSVYSTLFAYSVSEAIPYEALFIVFLRCLILICQWLNRCDTVWFRGGVSETCDVHKYTFFLHLTGFLKHHL